MSDDIKTRWGARTQFRDFATVIIYKAQMRGELGKEIRDNLAMERLEGYRKVELFNQVAANAEDSAIVVHHNVRIWCNKDTVRFPIMQDPHGVEMYQLVVHGKIRGYVEPAD